MSELS